MFQQQGFFLNENTTPLQGWCDLLHLLGGLLHVRQQGKMATVIQGAIILDQDGQRVGIRINASIVELQLGANSKSIDTGTLKHGF